MQDEIQMNRLATPKEEKKENPQRDSGTLPAQKKTGPILLLDVDGVIFYGNFSIILQKIIFFLMWRINEASKAEFFKNLASSPYFPQQALPSLKAILEKTFASGENYFSLSSAAKLSLESEIASLFPLIAHLPAPESDEKPWTAIDAIRLTIQTDGIVVLLTFNAYPYLIKPRLIEAGLTAPEAAQIYIICPPYTNLFALSDPKIICCELPDDSSPNKNSFIKFVKTILAPLVNKLSKGKLIFVDDQHGLTASKDVTAINVEDFNNGEHWQRVMKILFAFAARSSTERVSNPTPHRTPETGGSFIADIRDSFHLDDDFLSSPPTHMEARTSLTHTPLTISRRNSPVFLTRPLKSPTVSSTDIGFFGSSSNASMSDGVVSSLSCGASNSQASNTHSTVEMKSTIGFSNPGSGALFTSTQSSVDSSSSLKVEDFSNNITGARVESSNTLTGSGNNRSKNPKAGESGSSQSSCCSIL